MASSRTASSRTGLHRAPREPSTGAGWHPVARSAEGGTTPVPVGAAGQPYVVVRLRPGAEVTALPARCPHRLVPLATATVVDGRLQCGQHGWRFDAEGRCVDIPSLGADGTPPPRADLATPWAVEERDGWVWLAPERTAALRPPRVTGAPPVPEPAPPPPPPAGPVFGNLDPALDAAWHPVAPAGELLDGGYLQTRLLGRTWTVHRRGGALDADPPAWGVTEQHGLVWIAPAEPRDGLVDVPETTDPRFRARRLLPVRTTVPAALLADALLDTAHLPAGAADGRAVPDPDVVPEPGGFASVQELGGRQRVTHRYRSPFQLVRRTEEVGTGAVRTLLVLLQPEDADSTRVHACLLLRGPDGAPVVPPGVLAAEVAREQVLLAGLLARQATRGSAGLPLLPRAELHVPADRPGVALRRALADLAADAAGRTRRSGA